MGTKTLETAIKEREAQNEVLREVDALLSEWQGLATEEQSKRRDTLLCHFEILEPRDQKLCLQKLAEGEIISKLDAKQFLEKVRITSDEIQNGESERQGKTQAGKLISLAQEPTCLFFHDTTNTPFVRIRMRGHSEILPCRGQEFRQWLAHKYWESEKTAPAPEALSSALNVLEGLACFDGSAYKLSNRVAEKDGSFWYDLTDDGWRAVKITAEGWEIVPEPPILFRRWSHQAKQLEPIKDGNINELLNFVNLKNEHDKILFKSYVVSCFIPTIAHPISIVHGEKGTAKTTFSKILRMIIDPSQLEVLSLGRDQKEIIQALSHHWLAMFDNVSDLPDYLSDLLCRTVTGGGFTKRELYSNDDDIIYWLKSCIGLNGINIAATQPDLLDRALLFHLEPIKPENRREEQEFLASFKNALPSILGGIFDVLAKAMQIYPSVKLSHLPRMADFARWGYSIGEALGNRGQEVLRAYDRNIESQVKEGLQASPTAIAIRGLMDNRSEWQGTPTELYNEAKEEALKAGLDTKSRDWPKSPNWFIRRLNNVITDLRAVGITINETDGKKHWVTINKTSEITADTVIPSASQSEQAILTDGTADDSAGIPSVAYPIPIEDCDSIDGNDGILSAVSGTTGA